MHMEDRIAAKNLARARRLLNASTQLRPELPEAERASRVAEYARQIQAHGQIVAWLPPSEPRRPAYRSRFADGDALRCKG